MTKKIEFDSTNPIVMAFMEDETGPDDYRLVELMASRGCMLKDIEQMKKQCEVDQLGGIAYRARRVGKARKGEWMVDGVKFKPYLIAYDFKIKQGA